jgi:hypothetical protein
VGTIYRRAHDVFASLQCRPEKSFSVLHGVMVRVFPSNFNRTKPDLQFSLGVGIQIILGNGPLQLLYFRLKPTESSTWLEYPSFFGGLLQSRPQVHGRTGVFVATTEIVTTNLNAN